VQAVNILISSIGSGTYSQITGEANYNKAEYCEMARPDKLVKSAYIVDALIEFRAIDKWILLGTAGSQWQLYYEHLFRGDSNIQPTSEYDEDYSLQLLEFFYREEKQHIPLVEVENTLEELKYALGDFCLDLIALNYGLDNDEILSNYQVLTRIGSYLEDGDSVYFDITHSFRSLAFYELLAVSYIKNVLGKDIQIDFVSYGMYDFARENKGKTPIVDLSQLINILNWDKAYEEFARFGTTALLVELLEGDRLGIDLEKDAVNALKRLSDPLLYHEINEFRSLIKNCIRIVKAEKNKTKGESFNPFIRVFSYLEQRFGQIDLNDYSSVIAAVALWHYENKRYIQAAISAEEFTMTFCLELIRKSYKREAERGNWADTNEKMKRVLDAKTRNEVVRQFLKKYKKFKKIRNKLAHGIVLNDGERESMQEYLHWIQDTYKEQFHGNDANHTSNKNELKRLMSDVWLAS
jgi:CRISPR-associated Csx2 family protein